MVLYTFFTTGFALLLAGLGLMFYDSIYLREQAQEQMATESEVVRRVCEPVVFDRDAIKARVIVGTIALDQYITAVAIYLSDGQLLASHGEIHEGQDMPLEPVRSRVVRANADSSTEVLQPILKDEKLLA